jgi:hypothetical protein
MGGKTATTTQSVAIPPEVLARYNAVNARAEDVASTPFQQYSTDPSAFVAPLTPFQQIGMGQTLGASQMAQPYYGAAAGLTMAGAQPVGPLTQQQIAYYQNPYTQAVAAPTFEALRQQQAQEMQGSTANAIRSGAFGGDRSGLVAANLARQQQLGMAQAMAPIYQQGYQQAVQTAAGQQGVLGQDLARYLQAGQALGGLGAAAQGAALQGAQAVTGAGTLEQQTNQAGLQALYNQFLQQQGYPFQVAQFLANIAMGTGALSGSTTTTTQPAPFFSDKDEKTNIQKLGKGLYAYDYKADVEKARRDGTPMPPKRVGPMAQDIEKKKPGVVVDINDYKVVDPGRTLKADGGGLMPSFDVMGDLQSMGGAVMPESAGMGYARGGYAGGGLISDVEWDKLAQRQAAALGLYGQKGVLGQNIPGGGHARLDPSKVQPVRTSMRPGTPPPLPKSGLAQIADASRMVTGQGLGKSAEKFYDWGRTAGQKAGLIAPDKPAPSPSSASANQPAPNAAPASFDTGAADSSGFYIPDQTMPDVSSMSDFEFSRGGVAPHLGYAPGGTVYDSVDDDAPEGLYQHQGPGLNIPDSLGKYELMKPDKPPQQQGSGLGDIAALAKMAMFFMADGGVVPRHGYATDGAVEQPSDDEYMALLPRPTPEEVYPYAREKAKKIGLNPNIVERVIRGEWGGGQNYSGDEGSSHGPLQLHYGNVAPGKLSGRGLGDEFTQRTGLDARNPETWPQQIDFGLERMKKLGLSPWLTTQKKLGLGRWAAHGDTEPPVVQSRGVVPSPENKTGNLPAETSREVSYNIPGKKEEELFTAPKTLKGEPQSWGSFLTSRQFVVPLLTGLGAMASSPSRYLGAAALQGLGAGAQAFGEQEAQAELRGFRGREVTVREREATVKEVQEKMNLLKMLRETAAGYAEFGKPVPPEIERQIESLISDITKLGGNAGQAGPWRQQPIPIQQTKPAPSEAAPQKPTTEGKPTEATPTPAGPLPSTPPEPNVMDPKFLGKLALSQNPVWLEQQAEKTTRFDPTKAEKLRDRAFQIRQKILETGQGFGPNGEIVELPGFKEKKQYEANLPKVEEFFTKQANQASARSTSMMQLRTLSDILSKYKTGVGAKFESDAIRALRTVLPNIKDL